MYLIGCNEYNGIYLMEKLFETGIHWLNGNHSPSHSWLARLENMAGQRGSFQWRHRAPKDHLTSDIHALEITLWLCQNSYWKWP